MKDWGCGLALGAGGQRLGFGSSGLVSGSKGVRD